MFIVEYTEGIGWHDARIVPFQNISLSPADIKGALTSLPIYLALTLILTVIANLIVRKIQPESAMF